MGAFAHTPPPPWYTLRPKGHDDIGRCVAISIWEGNLRHGVTCHQLCERQGLAPRGIVFVVACGWEPRCIDHLLAGSLVASTICWLASEIEHVFRDFVNVSRD
jgi:hypothetical protein